VELYTATSVMRNWEYMRLMLCSKTHAARDCRNSGTG